MQLVGNQEGLPGIVHSYKAGEFLVLRDARLEHHWPVSHEDHIGAEDIHLKLIASTVQCVLKV